MVRFIFWMDYPSTVRGSRDVAIVAVFTALIVGSDFALSGPEFSNIKLLDTFVFVSAYVFGFRVGAAVAVLSETVWSFVSPIGMAGALTPFLVTGELLFALAGWGASRAWGQRVGVVSANSVFMGGILAVSAFLWDLETNAATALVAYWPTLGVPQVLGTMFNPLTLLFALAHEGSDFAFGCLVAPTFIALVPRAFGGRL